MGHVIVDGAGRAVVEARTQPVVELGRSDQVGAVVDRLVEHAGGDHRR